MLINALVVIGAIVVLLLAYHPLCSMPAGWVNVCHKLKYLAAVGGALCCVYIVLKLSQPLIGIALLAERFMWLWPRVIFWAKQRGYLTLIKIWWRQWNA